MATVIVRILPEHRRRGLGSEYLAEMPAQSRGMGAARIETVVSSSSLHFRRSASLPVGLGQRANRPGSARRTRTASIRVRGWDQRGRCSPSR
jgi:hypothetical protein